MYFWKLDMSWMSWLKESLGKKKKEKKESHEIEEFTLWEKKTNHRNVSKYIQNNVSLIKDSNESSIVCMDN